MLSFSRITFKNSFSNMKHLEYDINIVMSYGYTKEEAINILDGKNADGSAFVALPF